MKTYYSEKELVLDGNIMKAFIVAFEEFSKKQGNLEDFQVLILDEEDAIRITFVPNRTPGETISIGGRTSLGRSISYHIDKKKRNILKWHFHR